MHLCIRADGGPEIGYGHLVRTGALAEDLLSRGHSVTYATTTPEHVHDACPPSVQTVALPSRDDPDPFVAWLSDSEPDAVFTDAYPVDTDYQRAVREEVPLAVLQDDARHAICADLFLNGNLYAAALQYEFVCDNPSTYLGTDYVLLRQEIRDLAMREPPWRAEPERAIITMGGSDTANVTPTAVNAVDGFGMQIDVIVGPGFTNEQERNISAAATDVAADVRLLRDPDDLPERMFQTDIAVSTTSTTTYELLALGTPVVSMPVVDNQVRIATALRDRDLATVLDYGDGESAIRKAIHRYVAESELRRERRERGRSLVDGRGAERVADELFSRVAENEDA